MNISYNWLKQYVACDLAPEALAERLTMAGLEVDAVATVGFSLEGVVVGRVEHVRPHPNADRLVLCDVDLGPEHHADGNPVQIACGAPNVAAGQHVPVATVGATLMLPGRDDPQKKQAVTIERATLRGEASRGMICSEREMGLSEDHGGIMVLEKNAEAGQPFAEYLAARGIEPQDAVFDIELTPNRSDAASHVGVARDVAALTGRPLCLPAVDLPERGGAAAEALAIDIQAPEACPRYVGVLVRDVEVKESPTWLKRRLTAIGLRPRNNVVDVTNYVLHGGGQPLHAFDFDQIQGGKIIVREAASGEKFTTLDDVEHVLPEGALLICDAERPVALAGVMGGANSEVSAATTHVLIESAYFAPASIRRTARALGLSTDASYRFERGVDPAGQPRAAAWAARLIAELGGGAVVPGMVDAHPRPFTPPVVALRPARANRLLGLDLSAETMAGLLRAIGVHVQADEHVLRCAPSASERPERSEEVPFGVEVLLRCTVPSFRPDLERGVDLIEEIARLHGYDRIPAPAHVRLPAAVPREAPAQALRRAARARLSGMGFREIYTNSLLPKKTAERFNVPALTGGAGRVAETLKPISQEMAALRPSLLPGALRVMAHNASRGQTSLRLFELGHVFRQINSRETAGAGAPGYAEHEALLVAMTGDAAEAGWDAAARAADVFDLKGAVEALLEALHVPAVRIETADAPLPLMAYHAAIYSGEVRLGVLGRLAEAVAAGYDLEAPVLTAELRWSALAQCVPGGAARYVPVPRFPPVERDLAVVVTRAQAAGPLLDVVRAEGQPLLRRASVFDLYEGAGLPEGTKSLAFGLRFGADRTLTDAEVDARIDAITQALAERFDARLRQ